MSGNTPAPPGRAEFDAWFDSEKIAHDLAEERERLTERVAELVTEVNELRALVDEILDVTFDPDSPGATLQQIAGWRKQGQRAQAGGLT